MTDTSAVYKDCIKEYLLPNYDDAYLTFIMFTSDTTIQKVLISQDWYFNK